MAPTKDELEAENAELRARVAELEDSNTRDITGTGTSRSAPQRPTDDDGNVVLSEGERQTLIASGVAVSPFDGSTINALDELDAETVATLTPEARRRAEKAQQDRPDEVAPNAWPISGAPPAQGGDTNPDRA